MGLRSVLFVSIYLNTVVRKGFAWVVVDFTRLEKTNFYGLTTYPTNMAKNIVTKKRETLVGKLHPKLEGWMEWEIDVYYIVADSYSELIMGIDQIPANDLHWHKNTQLEELGFEGLPHKTDGKWRASLRTPKIGKGKKRPFNDSY